MKMKFCPECGTHVEGMKFCPECGRSLSAAVSTGEKAVKLESAKESEKNEVEITETIEAAIKNEPVGSVKVGFKTLMKSKSFGEFLAAKNNPEKAAEIQNRKWSEVVINSAKSTQEVAAIKKAAKIEKNAIKCPKCGSKNVQFMQQDKKSFSVGKALGGAVLSGGIGAIAGFAGKKGKKQWHCLNCSNVFETKK
jgi:DNA-directed RNA polymerase subunit M/transcription elongation factor TFIIS